MEKDCLTQGPLSFAFQIIFFGYASPAIGGIAGNGNGNENENENENGGIGKRREDSLEEKQGDG